MPDWLYLVIAYISVFICILSHTRVLNPHPLVILLLAVTLKLSHPFRFSKF